VAVVYTRGMVVDVDLPRLDGAGGWKQRPALIISTDYFHHARPLDLIVALITSRTAKYNSPTDHHIINLQMAGLSSASVVRATPYLISRTAIKNVRGTFSQSDMQAFERCLRTALGL
jgi:mRNA-degrading endonuclease toxin of MazEF toxin-antitoxin module